MITQNIDINKLAQAVGGSLENNLGFIAAELGDVVVSKAPVETGRMVRSISLTEGSNPKLRDAYRSTKIEKSVSRVKWNKKRQIRASAHRANSRRSGRRRSSVWYLSAGAPYSSNVHTGQAYRQKIKHMPRHRQRAAFANMRDKMKQRGEKFYQRKNGEGFNFFVITPSELAAATRRAAEINMRMEVFA